MLGLLHRPHGHHDLKSNPTQQVVIDNNQSASDVDNMEHILSPRTELQNPIDNFRPSKNGLASPQNVLFSPSASISNSMVISKRAGSTAGGGYRAMSGSMRGGFGRFSNSIVRDQHAIIRDRTLRELGSGVHSRAFDTSFEGLKEWIKTERLTRLPPKGGSWDRVLIAASYFAEQVDQFNRSIEFFTEESTAATNLVFGQILLLLELGHENAQALEKAFRLFYQFGLELAPLLRRADTFPESQAVGENLGRCFADLLQIVTGISVSFYSAVHSGRAYMKIDIFSSFGSLIDNFRRGVHKCAHEMWNITLSATQYDGTHVDILQKWLAPKDSVLAFLASDHITLATRAEQFTCTWIQYPLSSFMKSNDSIMLVEGKVGSGKTTLANYVVDRLQRPFGRKRVSTISFFFNYNIADQNTPLAMLKTLLYQLLSQRIGDVKLFNAINDVVLESRHLLTVEAQEEKMWYALHKALHTINEDETETLAIVIDGMYENEAFKTSAQQTSKKLYHLAQEINAVRLIQFSQPLGTQPPSSKVIELDTANMLDDTRTVVRARLAKGQHFKARDDADKEMIIEHLVEACQGNLVWVYLTCKYLGLQDTNEKFDNTLKTIQNSPKTIPEAVKRLIGALQLTSDCKSLLSFLVAAERPLQFEEVEALLRADVEQLNMSDRSIDVQHLLRHVSSFVVIGEDLVAIRHTSIKQALIAISTDLKASLYLKDRHKDILTRLFIYTKSCLRGEQEPTLISLDSDQAENRLLAHRLLQYATRYWTTHYQKTPFYKSKGDLELPKEFKQIFPSTVAFCLLEQACWNMQAFPHEALELHHVAFRVRQTIFGRNHPSVMQSAIFSAILCELVLSKPTEAIEWYSIAANISKTVIGVQADITVECCTHVLRVSELHLTNKRTTIMTRREEVLIILVESYKHRHSEHSREVLEIYKKLQELYININEEEKAKTIVEIIQKLTVVVYGSQSEQALSFNRHAEVVLKKHDQVEEVDVFGGFLFGGYKEETTVTFTFAQVEFYIKMALECISRNDFGRAEEIYIELWLKLTEHCRHTTEVAWHEHKIQVMLIYARFLEKQKRITESSAVLLAIWSEYEHHELSMTESIVVLLKDVAVCLKTIGLLTMSLTVFQKCWSFFKNQHKEQSSILKEIEVYISQTSKEVVKHTTNTAVTTTSSSSESIIREVFESSITTTTTTSEVSATTVELCQSLTKIYFREERWSEAITCIKSVLVKAWSSFFLELIESITVASSHYSECIELATKLAHCYIMQKRFEKAEEIYIRLYRVHRKTCKIDDVAVIKYSEMLIAFYSAHNLFTKAITFYQELLVEYRSFYGLTHIMTITILYALGDLCRRHHVNYGYWLEYYIEIVTNINKGALICHEDAFRALLIVAEHYYETMRYSESLVYFKSIFATFQMHGTKYKYFEGVQQVEILIQHYLKSLEETKIDIHAHVAILKELREACIKHYGAASSVTISITSVLAEVCGRNEAYQFEAISLYEHIMKHSGTVSKEVVKRTQSTLKSLYVKQITSKSLTTSTSKETVERATSLLHEHYLDIRKSYSCTHETSLTALKELVLLYHKQGKTELVIKELKSVLVECITRITAAKELIETAKYIASIFISCELVKQGLELVREFKLQVIYKITTDTQRWGFDITKHGRGCFALIASLEYHLCQIWTVTLAMYISDLVAEAMYYERFVHYSKIKSKFEAVLLCGAEIRKILGRTQRMEDFGIVESKAVEYCGSHEVWVGKIQNKASIRVFVATLLEFFSLHAIGKTWTATVGFASISHLKSLLKLGKHKEALDLATCTYHFLMAHEGLDDPTEITLGFQLCLMMAGKTENSGKASDPAVQKAMMDLSAQILTEVFDICKKFNFNIVRCQLSELNELVMLVGEQKNYTLLKWLLTNLWSSREGQTTWSQETVLRLGERLVQAQFSSGNTTSAIRLCEDIVYNVRRVNGVRHQHTLRFNGILASMYTSLATTHSNASKAEGTKNKKREEELARLYFKKALHVHEEVLKLLVNQDDGDDSDFDEDEDDSDGYSVVGGSASRNGSLAAAQGGEANGFLSREQEAHFVRKHIRSLQLAIQRFGGFSKPQKDYERLTSKVWELFGKDLKLGQEQVLANKWKVEGFGGGKAEAPVSEDGFTVPDVWNIVSATA